jgi:hypothetical protein
VSKEVECIQKILQKHRDIGTNITNCKIFLLSDRNATVQSIKEWIQQNTECRPVVAEHGMDSAGLFPEHGPFAMKGFFQDLALAAQANGGYIGGIQKASSSADLVRECYEYNHYILNHGKENPMPLLHCGIPVYRD